MRKLTRIMVFSAVMLTALTLSSHRADEISADLNAAPSPIQQCADINSDNLVDILDVVSGLKLVFELLEVTNPIFSLADLNSDGFISAFDSIISIRGIIDANLLPDECGPPPIVVKITSPLDFAAFSSSPITVSGTVFGDVSTLNVNSIPATIDGNTFSAELDIAGGNASITAVAMDNAGNVDMDTIHVTLDTRPPSVMIDFPPNGFVTNRSEITVTGMINDTVVGTVNESQAQVLVNGVAADVSNRNFQAVGVPLIPGENLIQAIGTDQIGNMSSASVSVTLSQNDSEKAIELVSGDNQTGIVRSQLPQPLVVALKSEDGGPVQGETVLFKVMDNSGLLIDGAVEGRRAAVTTNASGHAVVSWMLGGRAGAGGNIVQASSVGFAGMAVFTATGLPASPHKINVDAGNDQIGVTGRKLPRPLVAVVTDEAHNRLPNVPVTFRVVKGGGVIDQRTSVTVNTDGDGRAQVDLTLGIFEGIDNNIVNANFAGNRGLAAVFVASGMKAGDPTDTSISGVVLDNTNTPIEGVTMRVHGTSLETQTDVEGQFTLQSVPVGHTLLIADGSTALRPGTWPHLEFEMVTVPGRDNTLGMPIYLLPLDVSSGLYVDETTGGTLTLPDVPGFSMTIEPGSATFPDGSKEGTVSVTIVHTDKIPMVPNFGQQPRFVVTIQPAGVAFDPPAPLTIPNLDALAPGEVTEMYSFDHDLGQFVSIGTGTVSEDGFVIESDPGVGIIKGGWHCGGNPSQTGSSGSLSLSVEAESKGTLVNGRFTVRANGSPPIDTRYEWEIVENPDVVELISSPSCFNQPTCVAELKGKKKGTAKLKVTFICIPTGEFVTREMQVNISELTLTEVNFGGSHALKKTGNDTWQNDPFASEGDIAIQNPFWEDSDADGNPDKNEPIAYTKGTHPVITQAKVKIDPPLTNTIFPKISVVNDTETLTFNTITVPMTGDSATITNLTTGDSIGDAIDNVEETLKWKIQVPGDTEFREFDDSSHEVFVTFNTPSGYLQNPGVTAKRLSRAVEKAAGLTTQEAMALATSAYLKAEVGFESNNNIQDDANHWEVLDQQPPTGCDCISLAILAAKHLRMLGDSTAAHGRAYPTSDFNADSADTATIGSVPVILKYISSYPPGTPNDFEGFFEINDGVRKGFSVDPLQGPILESPIQEVTGDKLKFNVIKETLRKLTEGGGLNGKQLWVSVLSGTVYKDDDDNVFEAQFPVPLDSP